MKIITYKDRIQTYLLIIGGSYKTNIVQRLDSNNGEESQSPKLVKNIFEGVWSKLIMIIDIN